MKVYLVGAGPGDPGLVTLKAARVIGLCDTVVYDDLIPSEILGFAKPGARKIYVGKRAGKEYMKQPEINELLVSLAKEGRTIARIKGGDPCIFGRGGEEALFLKENNIPFEIIPGITSAIAGPISAGIPPTHRGIASSVKFITGHEDPSKSTGFLDWSLLARDTGTLVFLMGARSIDKIAANLMDNGMRADMPCALVMDATLPTQKHIISTLEVAGEDAKRNSIGSPSIIVVGEVARLSNDLFTPGKKPLQGRSIMITRPAHLAVESAALFAENGARVILYPLLEIASLPFNLPDITSFDIFIFTSQNAVPLFFEKVFARNLDARVFSGKEIYCIGPKTKDALRTYGIAADGMAEEYRAEGIVEMLKGKNLAGKRICLPRARDARSYLVDALKETGAAVHEIPVYETVLPAEANREDLSAALSDADTAVFTSPSGFRHALALLGDDLTPLKGKQLVAIGPVTGATMERAGLPADVVAREYTDAGIIAALKGE